LRRGRPTVHKQFDEALAILAGDALLNHALLVLAREPGTAPPAKGDPTRPAPGPWRITPVPPYLPAAAVLADTMWPDLPARAPAPPAAAPPTLVLWRQARLDAEQGAT